jgi:hypothetical protein
MSLYSSQSTLITRAFTSRLRDDCRKTDVLVRFQAAGQLALRAMFVHVLLLWLLLYAIRTILSRSSLGQTLGDILEKNGISCSLFHIVYETQYWNMRLYEWFNQSDRWKRKLLAIWFDCGILVMFLGQILSLITLTVSLFYSLKSCLHLLTLHSEDNIHNISSPFSSSSSSSSSPSSSSSGSTPLLTPIIPGVNFPLKYLFDFWICTFLVIIVHELGHAAAASMERLQIQGCGIFFLFLFPGAYVRIEESIQYLPMYPQLRVYSAGVWHNIVMAMICVVSLLSLPHLLSLGYISLDQQIPLASLGGTSSSSSLHWSPPPHARESYGVVITQLLDDSPLSQSIKVGDLLVSINDQPIQSSRDFQRFCRLLPLLSPFLIPLTLSLLVTLPSFPCSPPPESSPSWSILWRPLCSLKTRSTR